MGSYDEDDAFVFLAGYLKKEKNGAYSQRYIAAGSAYEMDSRQALTGMLRGDAPLPRKLRDILAALFDPDPEGNYANERELRLVFRGAGQRRDHWRNSAVAKHIWDAVQAGDTVASGVASAADKFGLDERQVSRVWTGYRKAVEAAYGV